MLKTYNRSINRILILIIFAFIFINSSYGQDFEKISELKNKISESSDTMRVNLLIDLSRQYIHYQKDSAFAYIDLALKEAEKINSKKSIAEIKDLSGYYYFLAERYNDAIIILHEAELYFDSVDSKTGLISCYDKLGLIYLRISNNTKSFEYYTKELKLAEETQNTAVQANAMNNIAIFYYNEKKYDEALEQYSQALEIYKNDDNKKGIGLCLNNIGEIYKLKGDYERAFEYYFEAKEILEQNEHIHELGYCLCNIGETHIFNNEPDLALNYILKAKTIFNQFSDTYGLAEVHNNIGEIYQKRKNYKQAIFNYELSLKYANQINSLEHLKDNYLKLSELFLERNDFKNSLNFHTKYTKLKDSIQVFNNTQTINQLKINYETEKKDKQIKVLSAEAELNKYKNLQKTIIIIILLAAFISLFVVLIVVFIQKNKKNEAYNDLVIKNLEVMTSHNELIETKFKLEKLLKEKSTKIKKEDNKYNKSNLNEEQKQELFDELILLMEEEKFYLQKNIKLNTIAKALETNNLYLSQVINQKANTNFNNFLNSYRINDARKHLSDPNFQNLSIEGIAYEVGFKSKSTFNIAFKKHTGITPSFFRAKAL